MSVPAKRRSRSRARRAKNNKHLAAVPSFSKSTDAQDVAVPHRLRAYVEKYASAMQEKRAARRARNQHEHA